MDFLTMSEVCSVLGKSDKTIQRYIKRGILHPDTVKSERGTPEYRFSKEEVETVLREKPPLSADTDRARGHSGIVRADMSFLQETMRTLTGQLEIKDMQIREQSKTIQELIERDRESNILLKNMQERILALPESGQTAGKKDRKDSLFVRLFPTFFKRRRD